MTVRRRPIDFFAFECDECGSHWTSRDAGSANEHATECAAYRLAGARLVGEVYDVDHPDAKWAGNIYTAIEHAQAAHKPYLAWNGHVYPAVADAVDFRRPLCRAEDVPDLTAAKR